MKKKYILDSSTLIEDHKSIEVLRNGIENEIFIPKTVIDELDGLKKNDSKRPQVLRVLKEIEKYKDHIQFLNVLDYQDSSDNRILQEIKGLNNLNDYTFVTNDRLFKLKAEKAGLNTEEYKNANPIKSEAELVTGFIELYNETGKIEDFSQHKNTFHFDETGKLKFFSGNQNKVINVIEQEIWKIVPRDHYQKALLHLLLDDTISLITVSGKAGSGKSLLATAAALYKVLQEKKYKKIYFITPTIEIGKELGFLPGDIKDKIFPYFRSIINILIKLHELRPTNDKIFLDETYENFNRKKIEFLPINFLRGETLEDCFVIVDESTNFSRVEMRSILSRMGENVKVVCTGDPKQIDNPYLGQFNNGLNWVVKKCLNDDMFAHIQLKGKKTRGPICDLVEKVNL